MRARLVGAGVGVLACAAVGLHLVAEHAAPDTSPSTQPPVALDIHDAITRVEAGLDPDLFTSVTPVAPRPKTGRTADLDITMGHQDTSTDVSLGVWEAALLAGDVGKLMAGGQGLTSQQIGHCSLRIAGRDDGRGRTMSCGIGDTSAADTYASSTRGETDEQLVSQASDAATQYGFTVQSVRVLHPLDRAVVLDLVSAPDRISQLMYLQIAVMGAQAPWNLEGLYIQVSTPEGEPVAVAQEAMNASTGGSWVAPAYQQYDDTPHG